MITEYHRPDTIKKALTLLNRVESDIYPLAGGTSINRPSRKDYSVVDLQDLGLNEIEKSGINLNIGAMVTLQNLLDYLIGDHLEKSGIIADLSNVIRREAVLNIRQAATMAGTIMTSDGRSSLITALLALDTTLSIHSLNSGVDQVSLGNFLPFRSQLVEKKIITSVTIPVNVNLTYEYVARTPADLPIVCAALCKWPSGRFRLALGGYADLPEMVFDGSEKSGLRTAAEDGYSVAGDKWASAQYRKAAAGILTDRCISRISGDLN